MGKCQKTYCINPKHLLQAVIIPSKLAYGKYGKRSIDPYTPLLCDMER